MRMTLKCCLAILIVAAFISAARKITMACLGSYIALSEISTFGGTPLSRGRLQTLALHP